MLSETVVFQCGACLVIKHPNGRIGRADQGDSIVPATFPSEEWRRGLETKLNSDKRYAGIARNWEGDLFFYVEPEGNLTDLLQPYPRSFEASRAGRYCRPSGQMSPTDRSATVSGRTQSRSPSRFRINLTLSTIASSPAVRFQIPGLRCIRRREAGQHVFVPGPGVV